MDMVYHPSLFLLLIKEGRNMGGITIKAIFEGLKTLLQIHFCVCNVSTSRFLKGGLQHTIKPKRLYLFGCRFSQLVEVIAGI